MLCPSLTYFLLRGVGCGFSWWALVSPKFLSVNSVWTSRSLDLANCPTVVSENFFRTKDLVYVISWLFGWVLNYAKKFLLSKLCEISSASSTLEVTPKISFFGI
jgi:hypothetical protein